MAGRMATTVVLLALLSLNAEAMRGSSANREMEARERPVMKVVRMLKDMQAQLQSDLDDDKAVHEKLACWCAENDKQKTAAIEAGNQKSEMLKSNMDEATAKILELKTKRKSTQEDMYADQKALGEATALRMEQVKEFQGTDTSLNEAIDAAQQAIVVLSEHHPEFAQLRSAAVKLQAVSAAKMLEGNSHLKTNQLAELKDFLQQVHGASSLLAIPGFQSYRPQSGQIFGILKQMVADFKENLSDAEKAEAKAKEEYAALKAAKEEQIDAAQKAIAQFDADLADNAEKHAQALKEFEDTQAQLALDTEFLANLKKKCSVSDEEFAARVKSRLEEIEAVQDTIGILNSDEAFDSFDKTVNYDKFFLQTSSSKDQFRRKHAAALLEKTKNPKLVLLAQSVQLDTFTKVIGAIDKMITELGTQNKDEIKHRDWCKEELAINERDTAAGYDKKNSLQTKIADLEKTIQQLTEENEATKKYVAELQEQMKRASEVREAENADNQQTIMDQRITQTILNKALQRMQQVYEFLQDQPGAAHTQTSGTHTDPGNGPAKFTKYEQNAGGSKVVQMLKTVIADSHKTEDETVADEEDAQVSYETMMKESNEQITTSTTKLNNIVAATAKAKESLSMANTDLKETVVDLEGLNDVLGDLKKSCDYIMKNFELRQEARTAEIDALKEAKGILSGMK